MKRWGRFQSFHSNLVKRIEPSPTFYSLNSFTILSRFSIRKSTSSFVLHSPNVVLSEPSKYSFGVPIETNTCDGASLPELHAEPVDTQIPYFV